jgi:hypothetical protein
MSPARRRSSSSRSGSSARRKASRRDFWNGVEANEEPVVLIRTLEDPSAMIRSLGAPPLPGRENVAEQYFALAYDKAARRAVALAAASGLIDLSEPED